MSNISTVVPDIDVNLMHRDVKLTSGQSITIRPWISTSYSNSNATFSMPPPSQRVFVDRVSYMAQPITVTYAGTTTGSALLQAGYDALRAYPLSSVISSTQSTINNTTVSMQTSEIVPRINRYKKSKHWSLTPTFTDKYQVYADGVGANNNPLGVYTDCVDGYMLRGAFPCTIVNGATSSTLTTTLVEPLYISPMVDDYEESLGFSNVRTFDVTINYNSNLARVVSHASSLATLSGITVTLGQPIIYQRYITPPDSYVPRDLVYGHQDINRFITTTSTPLTSNSSTTIVSTNLQLNAIPHHIYVWCQEATANLTYASTDTFLNINNISINFDNRSGLLSSASEYDLYLMSRANGLTDITWNEWHGVTSNLATKIGTVGSLLRLDFGKDITLSQDSYPGKIGNFNMQLNVGVTNVNQSASIANPSLYIISVVQGKYILHTSGLSEIQIGISPEEGEYTPFRSIVKHYGGSFSDFISKVAKVFTPVNKFLRDNKVISTAADFVSMLPIPGVSNIASTVGNVARRVGYGLPGGMVSGGQSTSRAELLEAVRRI